jgi:hypothetical protein
LIFAGRALSIPSGRHRIYGSAPPSIPRDGGPLRSVHHGKLVSGSRHRNEFELSGFPCRLPLTPRSPSSAASGETGPPRFAWSFLRPRRPCFNSSAERAGLHFEPNEMLGIRDANLFRLPVPAQSLLVRPRQWPTSCCSLNAVDRPKRIRRLFQHCSLSR